MPATSCGSSASSRARRAARARPRRAARGGSARALLARAVAQAPGERVGVALRGRRVGQRAGVLVDAEREGGRLERRDGDLALGEDADERRRQRAVLGEDDVLGRAPSPAGSPRVVVEDDLLHGRVERDRLELAEPRRVQRLDDDQPADRVELEPRRLDERRARRRGGGRTRGRSGSASRTSADDRARIEAARGQHRREARRSRCSRGWR